MGPARDVDRRADAARIARRLVPDARRRLDRRDPQPSPAGGIWTFWDYQAGGWQRDHGFRIDHLLLSPALADRLVDAGVDKDPRGREKASDHAPTWAVLG